MKRPLARAVARSKIERLVLRGDLKPGAQVKLADLALATGLGQTPLREAMIEAAGEGLLANHAGRGFFVPPLTIQEVNELYPMIWGLETLAVRLTPHFPPEQLARLRDLNASFAGLGDDPLRALELDSEWHRTLISHCGNQLLVDTVAAVKVRSRRYEYAFQRSAGHLPFSADHHEKIVRALEADDRTTACHLVEANWAAGPQFLTEWLSRD